MPFIQFQFRRGTSTEWSTNNPTLAAGEIGIETNTNLFKMGNGSTPWNSLSYGGLQGTTGSGSQGTTGSQGATGTQGDTGTQGTTGSGSQGTTGETGLQGTAGTSIQGATGTSIQGATGSGSQGTTGETGLQGTIGAQGPAGTGGGGGSGSQGTQGVQGTDGLQGVIASATPPTSQSVLWLDTSVPGVSGPQGTQGTQGTAGSGYEQNQGVQGITGSGSQGTTGDIGSQGTTGSQGSTGFGTQGTTGSSGFLNPFSDALTISNTTASTSKTTGSLILAGGLGVAGSVYSTASYDDKGEVRLLPINTQTTSYTLVAADHGKCVSTTSGVTVPASIFSAGQIISVFNNSASAITLTTSAVTAYKAGTDTAVTSLSLAARGIATVLFISATVVVISGNVT
jgi:hypothetical protein